MRHSFGAVCVLAFICGCGGVLDDARNSDDGTTDTCSKHTDCPETDLCIQSRCTLGEGRQAKITQVFARIHSVDGNGEAWDALGGAPDPLAQISMNGEMLYTTSTVDDSFEALWTSEVTFTIHAGSKLTVMLYDEDVSEHDLIGRTNVPDLLEVVRAGRASASQLTGIDQFSIRIEAL